MRAKCYKSNDPRWLRYLELHTRYLYMSNGEYDFRNTELASELGVTRRTLQRWTKGIGSPKEKHLKIIESFINKRGQSACRAGKFVGAS